MGGASDNQSAWFGGWASLLAGFGGLGGLEPEAVAFDGHNVHVVGDAIEQGPGHAFIGREYLGPIGERQVGGEDQAHLLVALAEEAEQVLGPVAVQWDGSV